MTDVKPVLLGTLTRGYGRIRAALSGFFGIVIAALIPALADNVITVEEGRALGILAAANVVVFLVPAIPSLPWANALKALAMAAGGVGTALTYAVYGDGIQTGEAVTLIFVGLTAAGILVVDNDPPAEAV